MGKFSVPGRKEQNIGYLVLETILDKALRDMLSEPTAVSNFKDP